jgi:uncharacterized repeat protein (TIGR01451 family)
MEVIYLTSGSPYYNLPGTTTPTWTCPELSPGDTVQVTYTAHVVQSGICKNQVVVEGEYNGQIVSDFSGAVVHGIVPCNPALTFEKKVWDEDTQQWVDSIHAPLNTVVTFSITITNTGTCDLWNVIVVDVLPTCLEYVQESATWASYLNVDNDEFT